MRTVSAATLLRATALHYSVENTSRTRRGRGRVSEHLLILYFILDYIVIHSLDAADSVPKHLTSLMFLKMNE